MNSSMQAQAEQAHHGISLHDLMSMFLRRKLYFILPLLVIVSLTGTYAIIASAVYRSEARILIEPKGFQPSDSASVASFTEHRIQIITEQLMTRKNISEMMRLFDLYPNIRTLEPDKAIGKFQDSVELKPINTELVDPNSGRVRESTIAFLLAFEYGDPEIAKTVTDNLVSLFLTKNQESRTSRVEQASSFLNEQADKLAEQVSSREEALATFKEKNAGKLPELQNINLQLVERAERQLLEITEEKRSLREQAIFVEAELSQTSRTGMLISSTGERILTNSEKIKTLQTELADAKRRYSSSHPDVKRLERQLKEARANGDSSDAEFYANDKNAPDNPAYIQLQSKLRSLRTEITALSRRESGVRTKVESYEKSMTESPAIEREYLALTRDYENILEKYRETRQRVLEAQLSEAAEKGNQSDSFTVLEAPRVNHKPVRPNRLSILIIGLMLGTIIGMIAVYIADQMDRSVRNARDLVDLIGGPPLCVIGYIDTTGDIWKRRFMALLIIGAIATAVFFGYIKLMQKPADDDALSTSNNPVVVSLLEATWNP